MRRSLLLLLCLACATGPARGGVYILSERFGDLSVEKTRDRVTELRSAALPDTARATPFKTSVANLVKQYEQVRADGLLSTLDLIDLSGGYLRLGRTDDALRLLVQGDRSHFLVQSNLAAAYFQSGQTDLAIRHQQLALAAWPEAFSEWSQTLLADYRMCERYLLTLYRSRFEESRRGGRAPVDPDPLFPGFRYVGEGGQYQAGSLSREMRDKMPPEAFLVLRQLNLWFPTDYRLYWQLGEMLNAGGHVGIASAIFTELGESGVTGNFNGLRVHRKILRDAEASFRVLVVEPEGRGKLAAVGSMLAPAPAEGGLLGTVALLLGKSALPMAHDRASVPELPPSDPPTAGLLPPPAPGGFNPQHVAISFVFGMIAALLLAWQVSLWRAAARRRRGVHSA